MKCELCGEEIKIGSWPYCPHQSVNEYHPFKGWFDEHLGCEITSLSQWNREMKVNNLEIRDKMSPGAISAREDRCNQERKEKSRAV
jgi:hypothetical protein